MSMDLTKVRLREGQQEKTKKQCTEGKVRSLLLLMESMICGMLIQREQMGFRLECDK